MSQEEINQQDRHGFTALHYAAQNGATMCCMYLTLVNLLIESALFKKYFFSSEQNLNQAQHLVVCYQFENNLCRKFYK